jgi:uncharacterized protein YicC (UPF0701 family)
MTEQQSKMHAHFTWAKERLDEIEATLAAVESKLGSIKSESKDKVKQAISEMQAQRDAFKHVIKVNREAGEAAWREGRAKLEQQWSGFEHAVEQWAHATHDQFEQQKSVFAARVDAQTRALNEALTQFKRSAQTFTAARKSEVDAAFNAARAHADEAKAKVDTLRKAGKDAWTSLNKSLVETRAAFDRANKAAHEGTGHSA